MLFTPGCNLRCGFCHNWRIAVDPQPPFLQEATALEILESRKRYVTPSWSPAANPACTRNCPSFLAKLKERGFMVKLDTNGFFPDSSKNAWALVDYVAMDVKTAWKNTGGWAHKTPLG